MKPFSTYLDSHFNKNFTRDEVDLSLAPEKIITGILNPIKWYGNGKIKEFSIYSNEEDIIIEGYRKKRKLENLLNKLVVAKGQIRIGESGEKFIKLKSIKELKSPTSPPANLIKPRESIFGEEYSVLIPKEYAFIKLY